MKKWLAVFLFAACACCSSYAQIELRDLLDKRLEASRANLRNSLLELRATYAKSCALFGGKDCDIVALTDARLVLMDIESKYSKLAELARNSDQAESRTKVKRLAADAGELIDDAANEINKQEAH